MLKAIGLFLLVSILVMMFVPQTRDCVESALFGKQGKSEEKVIGPVSGFNPRVREMQEVLKSTGLYSGPTDGMMSRDVRTAIKGFQKTHGLKPTGIVDKTTYAVLNKEKEKIKNRSRGSSRAKPISIQAVSARLKPQESKDDAPADSKAKLQDEIMGYRLKSKERTKQVQTALKKAGFYNGEIDGKMGLRTKAAIAAFQKTKGLNPDGVAGQQTFDALKVYLDKKPKEGK